MQKSLIALALVGLVDSVSYMVVAPSLIFYVLQSGGTKENYGIILSAFSFASFCFKPILGAWSDRVGYRLPYIVALTTSAVGGIAYLSASSYTQPQLAVDIMLVGRLLGGVGGASSALGFAFSAKVVDHADQTKVNSLLSMVRILGMASGPVVNVFLSKINMNWGHFHLGPLNSVGLVLFGSNILGVIIIFFLLEEPDVTTSASHHSTHEAKIASPEVSSKNGLFAAVRPALCLEVVTPILSTLWLNANFQLIETGFAPAASHALGWGPVGTSTILGSLSLILAITMLFVYQLSIKGFSDETLLKIGQGISVVAYTLMWAMWVWKTPEWKFVLPILIATCAFPFLAAPSRSVFTKAVDSIPELAESQGVMQAVLSMAASVAGFATPGLVATYVLRHPTQVEASHDHRELAPTALVAPCGSFVVLVAVFMIDIKAKAAGIKDDKIVGEATSLLLDSELNDEGVERNFSVSVEVNRRLSGAMMAGICQTSLVGEHDEPHPSR